MNSYTKISTTTMTKLIIALLLLALAPTRAKGNAPTLRGSLDIMLTDGESYNTNARTTSGAFGNECLRGRFSYFNVGVDVASLTVGVFDGNGGIPEFDATLINHPDGEGNRVESTISFNSGSYEVDSNGRGRIYMSLGEEGGPYFDPPAEVQFVVTSTNDDCEITAMDSFVSSHVGLSSQLITPHWSKIADS
mmetsp:Transcript_31726/g.76846  ORF Transcript_31726/g.76846 Transcript_31726/m.76846 type:complete len:192 (+) Transcript_31726:45-620(+)